MHPMTQTGLGLLALALSILTFCSAGSTLYHLFDLYRPGKSTGSKALLAALLAVAAVGALLMFIGRLL